MMGIPFQMVIFIFGKVEIFLALVQLLNIWLLLVVVEVVLEPVRHLVVVVVVQVDTVLPLLANLQEETLQQNLRYLL